MSDRAWVSTRKGLFELRRRDRRWSIERLSFPGDPVSAVLAPDPRAPARPMIAALNLGHFGVRHGDADDVALGHVAVETKQQVGRTEVEEVQRV